MISLFGMGLKASDSAKDVFEELYESTSVIERSFLNNPTLEIQKIEESIRKNQKIVHWSDYTPLVPYKTMMIILILKSILINESNVDLFFDMDFLLKNKRINRDANNLYKILRYEKMDKKIDYLLSNINFTGFKSLFDRKIPKDRIAFYSYVFLPKLIKFYLDKHNIVFKNHSKKMLKPLVKAILSAPEYDLKEELRKRDISSFAVASKPSKQLIEGLLETSLLDKIGDFAYGNVIDEIANKLSDLPIEKLAIWNKSVAEARAELETEAAEAKASGSASSSSGSASGSASAT